MATSTSSGAGTAAPFSAIVPACGSFIEIRKGAGPSEGQVRFLDVGGQRGDGERRRRLHELVTERGRAVLECDLLDLQLELGRRVPRLSGRTRLIPIVRGARR
jgi:hypothetical protein